MSKSDLALSIRGLSKSYTIAHHQGEKHSTLAESMLARVRNPFKRAEWETFWALKDVSFHVEKGEVVGIIGRNGAGKSTLLKILSRITEPSAGEIDVYGPIGSLLEVGTGFHPELTGRENVFLNGAILGMTKAEIRQQFDAIIDFAGVEKFLDTPVKRYSSGMFVRLAFAVAAHLRSEILIVDEVLAVGDGEFQKRCIGKMKDVAGHGRTVLFVSHNMSAVQSLCNRSICLCQGELILDGPTADVITHYWGQDRRIQTEKVWEDSDSAPGAGPVKLRRVAAYPTDGDPTNQITIRTPFTLEFDYWNEGPDLCLNLSLRVYNKEGVVAFNSFPAMEKEWHGRPFPRGIFRSRCLIPGDLLNDGRHSVELLIVKDQGFVLYKLDNALTFDVQDSGDTRGAWFGEWPGAVRPQLCWTTEMVSRL